MFSITAKLAHLETDCQLQNDALPDIDLDFAAAAINAALATAYKDRDEWKRKAWSEIQELENKLATEQELRELAEQEAELLRDQWIESHENKNI